MDGKTLLNLSLQLKGPRYRFRHFGGEGSMVLVGYARVSTVDQETRLQHDALRAAGVRTVYEEKASAVSSRPVLQRALSVVRPGDTFVVWKFDRLARSLPDLLAILARLERAGVAVKSLTEPIDTVTALGRFSLQILGAVAELERGMIRERSMAGQAAAVARGARIGRPRSLDLECEAELVRLWGTGLYTLDTLADVFGIHPSSVKRAVYRVHKPCHSSLQ